MNPLITAETFLAREDFKNLNLIDVEDLAAKYAEEGICRPTAPATHEAGIASAPPQSSTQVDVDSQLEQAEADQEAAETACAEADMAAVIKNAYPTLMLPSHMIEKLRRLDPASFSSMREHASLRAELSVQQSRVFRCTRS